MLKKWIIRLSLTVNLLLLLTAGWVGLNRPLIIQKFLGERYAHRVSFFEHYPLKAGDIVFLGDSITEGGRWEEIFPDLRVKNRGIGGDTTTGVLERLLQVTQAKPAAVFLKIGTNDLTHGPEERATSYGQYREIVERIQRESPQTQIYLQSLLPRGESLREEVEAFNAEIVRIAGELEVEYVELYPHFLAADGSIDNAFSRDELHLNGAGYQQWQSLLEPDIESLLGAAAG